MQKYDLFSEIREYIQHETGMAQLTQRHSC